MKRVVHVIKCTYICTAGQVFLPLLLEHFSEAELRRLTTHVLELHHLGPVPTLSCDHAPIPNPPAAEADAYGNYKFQV